MYRTDDFAALPSPAALHLSEFLVTGILALICLAVRCRRTLSATVIGSSGADGEDANMSRRLSEREFNRL